jgi:hypothetical protein
MIKVNVFESGKLNHPFVGQLGLTSLDCVGDTSLLDSPMIGVFSSAKCPASQILKAHDYAKEI